MRKLKSFTLLEVLITAAILVLFAAALIGLSSVSSKNIVVNKHRLQAANLAREGAELVTQMRDTAWLNGAAWKGWSGLTAGMDNPDCWGLGGSSNNKKLEYRGPWTGCMFSSYHWRLVDGSEEITKDNVSYTREIKVEDLTTTDRRKVTVKVSWQDFGQNKEIKIIGWLTDWKE